MVFELVEHYVQSPMFDSEQVELRSKYGHYAINTHIAYAMNILFPI